MYANAGNLSFLGRKLVFSSSIIHRLYFLFLLPGGGGFPPPNMEFARVTDLKRTHALHVSICMQRIRILVSPPPNPIQCNHDDARQGIEERKQMAGTGIWRKRNSVPAPSSLLPPPQFVCESDNRSDLTVHKPIICDFPNLLPPYAPPEMVSWLWKEKKKKRINQSSKALKWIISFPAGFDARSTMMHHQRCIMPDYWPPITTPPEPQLLLPAVK